MLISKKYLVSKDVYDNAHELQRIQEFIYDLQNINKYYIRKIGKKNLEIHDFFSFDNKIAEILDLFELNGIKTEDNKLIIQKNSKNYLKIITNIFSIFETTIINENYKIRYYTDHYNFLDKIVKKYNNFPVNINIPKYNFKLKGQIFYFAFISKICFNVVINIEEISNSELIKSVKKMFLPYEIENKVIKEDVEKNIFINNFLFGQEKLSKNDIIPLCTIEKDYLKDLLETTKDLEKYYYFFSKDDMNIIEKNLPIVSNLLEDNICIIFDLYTAINKNFTRPFDFSLQYENLKFSYLHNGKNKITNSLPVRVDCYIYHDSNLLTNDNKVFFTIIIKSPKKISPVNKSYIYDTINFLDYKEKIKKFFPDFESYEIAKITTLLDENISYAINFSVSAKEFLNNLQLYIKIYNNINKTFKKLIDEIFKERNLI